MRYLCLVYAREAGLAAMSPEERASYATTLRRSGRELAAAGEVWMDGEAALRLHQGAVTLVAAPGAEPAGTALGVLMIEARDLNDALRLAGRLPVGELGSVEVRPAEGWGR